MIDWWALGILLYEMMIGQPPYNENSPHLIMNDILKRSISKNDMLSSKAYKVIRSFVEKDPKQRLGSDEMGGFEGIKKHPFFKDIDFYLLE